jgi:hypothetical protein
MNLSNNSGSRQQQQQQQNTFRGRNVRGSMLASNMLHEIINTKPTGGCASCGSSKKIGR